MNNRINFLGCPIDSMTMQQTIDRCLIWCSDDESARTLITVNAGILIMMRSDPLLKQACTKGDVIVADGVPVVWASRLLGTPLAGRVAGVDLMQQLLQTGHKNKLRIFLLGAKQEVIDKLSDICNKKYPDLVIAGIRNGYFKESDYPEVIHEVKESKADILFIGMPTPFKEIWSEQYRDEFGVSVIIGVGGSFDVLAGFVQRAPVWMQNIGMEWFWRLLMEPRKMWKRYLVTNTQFLYFLGLEFVRQRIFRMKNT